MNIVIFVFICIILLFLSAFLSGSETALFSLSEPEIEEIRTEDRKKKHFFDYFKKSPHNLLTTILFSNTLVNVTFSFLITIVFLEFAPHLHMNVRLGMLVNTIFITIFLLIFGEFTPKFYALRRPKELSRKCVIPLFYLMLGLKPIVFILNLFNRLVVAGGKDKIREEISYSELKTLFEESEKEGVFEEQEKEIVNSLFTLTESVVSEVMIPRTKLFSIRSGTTIGEAYSLLLDRPYSRIPVYSNKEEKFDGILYLKDLLIYRNEKKRDVKSILREALFVPEKMRLKDLFLEFRKKRVHFAIVVNEFGGVEGVVTMNDILEEVVGSIKDEYHRVSIPLYRYISRGSILVDGELKIDDFPGSFYGRLPRGDYETISGFIQTSLGRVPKENESFAYKGLVFRVIKLAGRRLEKILISKKKNGREEK